MASGPITCVCVCVCVCEFLSSIIQVINTFLWHGDLNLFYLLIILMCLVLFSQNPFVHLAFFHSSYLGQWNLKPAAPVIRFMNCILLQVSWLWGILWIIGSRNKEIKLHFGVQFTLDFSSFLLLCVCMCVYIHILYVYTHTHIYILNVCIYIYEFLLYTYICLDFYFLSIYCFCLVLYCYIFYMNLQSCLHLCPFNCICILY